MTGKAANKEESVDLVDLVDVDDLPDYEELRAKEQAELIKKQNLEAATKSVKLAEFQCIICMDNPTDLTVTYCGMYAILVKRQNANLFERSSILL